MSVKRCLGYGEPMPLVSLTSNRNPKFALGSIGGRFLLLVVVNDRTSADEALAALAAQKYDERVRVAALVLAGAALNAEDDAIAIVGANKVVFRDVDNELTPSLLDNGAAACVLFDPNLRLLQRWPLAQAATAVAALGRTPEPDAHADTPLHAPVLITPRVFERSFCEKLIEYYKTRGGEPTGTTRENADGKTFVALDPGFKRRDDCTIEDAALREAAMQRIFHRLLPDVEKAFMWRATRMERYIVARYGAEDGGGFFRPHRDNTTKGTAHRRFAVTINLNAEGYEGGDLRFPEHGGRTYRAPTGGAVVFSCALLHEATPVTRGERFAFLPFLYDEAAAAVRAAANPHLDASVGAYQG